MSNTTSRLGRIDYPFSKIFNDIQGIRFKVEKIYRIFYVKKIKVFIKKIILRQYHSKLLFL